MPAMQEPITQTEGQAESAPVHPEEIRASVDLRIGQNVALRATVRTTPVGLVTAGVVVAVVLSITALVRAIRRRDPPGGAIH
jgi:tetrahydromethanopterin S-methyltransferase subunit F